MKLKHFAFIPLLLFFIGCKFTAVLATAEQTTFEKLATIPTIVSIEKTALVGHFNENYEIWFEQPINHNDLSKGTFKQRVFLGFENVEKPVIVQLRGYGARSNNASELADHYKANQITIEHRYFNNSRPKEIDWNTLTVENAAKDQAIIIDAIRTAIYPNSKFVSTGISKGCQTTMAHRSFFPDNVDACVCYVGPLNSKREDPKIFEFLKNVGTENERQKIQDFQELCFENRSALLGLMKQAAKTENLSWEFGVEKALDYSILEYSFAFWQWGTDSNTIPSKIATPEEIYKHLIAVVGYGFFEESAVNDLQPYFWAALTQQGIYGYETAPFKKYLNTEEVYKFDWAFPKNIAKPYDVKPMEKIKLFLDTSAEKMLFIYGEYDAWSATAVELNATADKREVYKFVKPKGDHKTRIKSFEAGTQKNIYEIIDGWLKK